MPDRLRVAVVGAGFWGKNHLRVLSELPEAELVAVCDLDEQRAKAAAEKYGIKAYVESMEMYRREHVEAVNLCVWSTRLAEEAMKALRMGKHVLVEKPMASSVREAKKIVEMAKSRNLRLMVGFIERFNPAVRRLKQAIDDGEIGLPVSVTVRRVSRWPERIGDVGVVKDTAIHDIDIVRYIFGEEPIAVFARTGNLRHERFEDYAQIMLAFPNGKSAFIEANWLTPYKVRRLTVTGSEAIISLDYITQEMTIETLGQTLTPRYEWEEPLKIELKHFVQSILEGNETMVTGLDGLKALQIAEAALRSAAKERMIKLA
ncbi:MAG: Gfo/Idh/MocA family oxidoreductase [Nitrososphaerota archaeon]|nr:Gfo/Idh/MocA family oxidoreductase [Candidatus Bathyarchaeota archaeon]MDW8049435.1 Gfo/Idh/MocA family oxidoreductase [Nitrososphaerota archaeon]